MYIVTNNREGYIGVEYFANIEDATAQMEEWIKDSELCSETCKFSIAEVIETWTVEPSD